MREVGAFEAKDSFGQLLDLVERGEEVAITRHGRVVARLVPPKEGTDCAAARAAVHRLRARAKSAGLGPFDWTEWKDFRDTGRP